MPNIKSAKKRVKTTERNKLRNVSLKSAMRTAIKTVNELSNSGKIEEAKNKIPLAYQAIDKASKKDIIHKNAANRLKSRITKKVKSAVK
jgi:small subunit ribosomal protein S20